MLHFFTQVFMECFEDYWVAGRLNVGYNFYLNFELLLGTKSSLR